MSTKDRLPETLVEAIRYFSDIDVCTDFVAALRWPDGWACPVCGCAEYSYLKTRRLWKCKACKKQSSVKVGTIFEDSAISLSTWLAGIWLVANSKNGVSSHEMARSLGITQKSAWFLLHRIRLAMQVGHFDKLDGEVEVDETFIGGKARNMHASAKKRRGTTEPQGSGKGKTIVVGALERGGKVRPKVVTHNRTKTLTRFVKSNVESGSTVYTDALPSYNRLAPEYQHAIIDHSVKYVDGRVHTNGIENFWSLLKRGLAGTYISVQPFHLFRYLDERAFTFNERERDDLGRFVVLLGSVAGRRVTWNELTGKC